MINTIDFVCVSYFKQANQTTSTLEYKDLIVFLVSFLGEESGLLELVLQGVHTLLIGQRPVLEHLTGTVPNHNFSMTDTDFADDSRRVYSRVAR